MSHIGISDHSLIYAYRKLSIDLPSRGNNTVTYRKFKNPIFVAILHIKTRRSWVTMITQMICGRPRKNCSFVVSELTLVVLTSMPPCVINVFALANHLGLLRYLKSVCMQEIFLS